MKAIIKAHRVLHAVVQPYGSATRSSRCPWRCSDVCVDSGCWEWGFENVGDEYAVAPGLVEAFEALADYLNRHGYNTPAFVLSLNILSNTPYDNSVYELAESVLSKHGVR